MKNRPGEKIKLASIDELLMIINIFIQMFYQSQVNHDKKNR